MEERLEGEALAQSTDSSNTSNNAMKSSSRTSLLTMDQKHSSSDIFISISGLIGAGKSTLATKLAEKMGLPCFYEPVMDNEYLSDFYRDPARYSFPLQVTLSLINYCVLLNPPPSLFISADLFIESSFPAAPVHHLAGTRRSAGQNHLWRFRLC